MQNRHLKSRGLMLALAAGLLTIPALALATPSFYNVTFTSLNDSGVLGTASLKLDNNLLTVHIHATGLMPNEVHPQHIHGPFDSVGNPTQAVTPTLAAVDANNDGVIELGEGQMTYGPILVPLSSPPGGALGDFPTAPSGTINFTEIYDLTDSSIYAAGFDESDLFPLTFREIVIHGLDVPFALTDGGVDYVAGQYDPVLPVASGVIQAGRLAVPEPSSIFDMLAGLGAMLALVGFGRRRMRHVKTC
ncbi:MAG: PEP-CTERM sorting domain-containing protein [Gammaproteobacteria bacterium]